MDRMIESIRKYGTLTPGLARPLPEGGYELVSGHRRLAACQALVMETMPVIVREMTDDEAVIAMVDANLQRETILPSEKAFAYKMKRDALNHQGVASPQVGEKLLTVEKVGLDGGDSKNQVLRYIRLTVLTPGAAFPCGRRQDRLLLGGGALVPHHGRANYFDRRHGPVRLHAVPRTGHPHEARLVGWTSQ